MKVKVFEITEKESYDVDEDGFFEELEYDESKGRCHLKRKEKECHILAVNKYGVRTDWKNEKVDWVHIYDNYSVKAFKKEYGDKAASVTEPGTYAMEYKVGRFIPVEKLIERMASGLNNAVAMLKTLTDLIIEDNFKD